VKVLGGKTSTFALQDGTFTATADLDQVVDGLTVPVDGAAAITGTARYVSPVTAISTDKVTISSITVDVDGPGPAAPKTFGPLSVRFGMLLGVAHYTLTVGLKETLFAGSNIYWDDAAQHLTFAPTSDNTKQGYQGVFFKWGSLIGISPALTAGAGSGGTYFSTDMPIYVPDVSTHTSWSVGKVTDYALGGSGADDTYDEIPYTDPPGYIDRTINYLYGISDAASYSTYKGDICRYLTDYGYAPPGNWRMPTDNELLDISGVTAAWSETSPVTQYGGWTRIGGATWATITPTLSAPADAHGTHDLADLNRGGMHEAKFFLLSGYRETSGNINYHGQLAAVGS
jgi:hypothetical protein